MIGKYEVQVIHQVRAHARQVMDERDAVGLQVATITHTGQLQQLRRENAAAGHDDFAAAAHPASDAIRDDFDPDGPLSLEEDARAFRFGEYPQVGALAEVRSYVRLVDAEALAFLHHDLGGVVTLLLRAIEVGIEALAGFRAGPLEELVVGIVGSQVLDPGRAVVAVVLVAMRLVVLRFPEVRQDVRITPASISKCRPVVVVATVAAHVDQGVDGRAATEAASEGVKVPAPIESRLRRARESPVVRVPAGTEDDRTDGGTVTDDAGPVRARLEQGDAGFRVFGQAARGDATAGTAAHHDVVELRHLNPLLRMRPGTLCRVAACVTRAASPGVQ